MSTNRITLVGYVGKDLKSCKTGNGSAVTFIRVATHCKCRRKNEEKEFITVWHDVVCWDRQAIYASQNFVKGSRILVEGVLKYRVFPDKNNHKRYHTQIHAFNLINLDR